MEWDGEEDESFGASFNSVGRFCRAAGFSSTNVLSVSPACPVNVMWKQKSRCLHRERGKISKSDSKRESEHPGNLSPVQEVVMMLSAL